ncbi:hypothetical protein SAMN05444161_7087 [Rhizobiales bacterium GAS191]|nr:hypothetical protein SAMN05444161_7087 [Rhizobiales bacterium GAS191]
MTGTGARLAPHHSPPAPRCRSGDLELGFVHWRGRTSLQGMTRTALRPPPSVAVTGIAHARRKRQGLIAPVPLKDAPLESVQ